MSDENRIQPFYERALALVTEAAQQVLALENDYTKTLLQAKGDLEAEVLSLKQENAALKRPLVYFVAFILLACVVGTIVSILYKSTAGTWLMGLCMLLVGIIFCVLTNCTNQASQLISHFSAEWQKHQKSATDNPKEKA